MKKKRVLILGALFVLLVAGLTMFLFPYVQKLRDPQVQLLVEGAALGQPLSPDQSLAAPDQAP